MNRLEGIEKCLGKKHPFEYLKLIDNVEEKYLELFRNVEQFCERQLHTEQFLEHYQKATFPYYLLPKINQLGIPQYFVPAPYGKQLPLHIQGLLIALIASHDTGISTFLFLQLPLSARTISLLGSEQQKQKYLPDLVSLKKICGWALTEREVGSNSTRLGTTFTKKGEGFLLNGDKRWIGNGVNDLLIVYGNMADEKRVVGALIENSTEGVVSNKIQNKYAFRLIQNAQVEMQNVKVEKDQFLPGASSYKKGVEQIIKHSRLIVIWNTVGACVGIYNLSLKHVRNMQARGEKVSILIKQRLGKMMGQIQAMLLSAWRLTELSAKDVLQTATVGMFKGWTTSRGRQIAIWGRQICEQLGSERQMMKMVLDMEVLYTYEGSYDMNMLLAGSQLTGIKAFT